MPDLCGATKRNGPGEPCKLPAGWGTDHVGEGRCKHHDGGGAPEGNKNAVTTGEHEAIFYDQLDDEEQQLWHQVNADQLVQIDQHIRTHNVRMRRMMERVFEARRENDHERVQRIEEGLTRVQKELRKLIREKYRILKDQPADNSEKLDELLSRMDSMRDDASDYEPPNMDS